MSISIIGSSTRRLRQKFSQSTGLPIREALTESDKIGTTRRKGMTHMMQSQIMLTSATPVRYNTG